MQVGTIPMYPYASEGSSNLKQNNSTTTTTSTPIQPVEGLPNDEAKSNKVKPNQALKPLKQQKLHENNMNDIITANADPIVNLESQNDKNSTLLTMPPLDDQCNVVGLYLHIKDASPGNEQLLFHNESRYMSILSDYEHIYQQILRSEQQTRVLTGSSGLGKTSFIYYFLYRLMKERPDDAVRVINSVGGATTNDKVVWNIFDSPTEAIRLEFSGAPNTLVVTSDIDGCKLSIANCQTVQFLMMPPHSYADFHDTSRIRKQVE